MKRLLAFSLVLAGALVSSPASAQTTTTEEPPPTTAVIVIECTPETKTYCNTICPPVFCDPSYVDPAADPGPEQPRKLAYTGTDPFALAAVGVALLVVGVAARSTGSRKSCAS